LTAGVTSFAHAPGQVHYDRYAAGDVLPAMEAAEAAALAGLDAVAAGADPLRALDEALGWPLFVANVAEDLANTLGGAGWPQAARVAGERSARFRAAVFQRRDLYDAVRALDPADPVERRLRADLLNSFEAAGAHLAAADRVRLAAITARLAELGVDFMTNLRAVNAASGVAARDVGGLPDDLVRRAGKAAAERGLDGWWVPYSDANAGTVLREATDRELREAMYRLTINRAAAVNGPVVTEVAALRQELATLLGYRDYVASRAPGRMVADPDALLARVAAAYRPHAEREHAELLAFARDYTGDPGLELTAADVDPAGDGF
jgi:Zn-dependent oligopeptidase